MQGYGNNGIGHYGQFGTYHGYSGNLSAYGETETATQKAQTWWNGQSTGTKVAVGLGVAAAVGGILYLLAEGAEEKKNYKGNKPRTAKRGRRRVTGSRARAKKGRRITLKGGKRYGHLTPPKDYYDKGARRPDDYAGGNLYVYPLIFRTKTGKVNRVATKKHIRAAQSYFARESTKTRYPIWLRKRIARNINRAKKKYGIGGKPASPRL